MFSESFKMVLMFVPLVVAYGILLDCVFQIPNLVKLYKTEYKPLSIPFKVFAMVRNHKMFLEDYKAYGPLYVFKEGRSY